MSTRRPAGRSALAAGAARAGGERARRRSTPLIGDGAGARDGARSGPPERESAASPEPAESPDPSESPDPPAPAADPTSDADEPAPDRPRHRPVPRVEAKPTKKAASRSGTRPPTPARKRSTRRARTLTVVPDPATPESVDDPAAVPAGDGAGPTHPAAGGPGIPRSGPVTPGVEDLVRAAVAALRFTARASGLEPGEVDRQVAATLAFLRRRVTGDYSVDDFGFDEEFTENVYLPLLRPLYRAWFRVEVRGIENIPETGGALVVGNHSGTVAMDSLMTQVAVHDEHPRHRHLRMLGADLVFQTPVIGQVARKSGSTLAAATDAERLLGDGQLVGVWPEGFKGVGKPFSERYKLQRFGRGGFVSAALRTGVPIVPCSIVGAEEIYPILGNMSLLARVLGVPYAPVTPTWPLLGPLGLVPLPSKWIIEFGAPVDTASLGPAAADDPMLVFDLTDQVRETIQQTLYALLMRRRSVFS